MLKMRFGSFVWPNNPRTYTISCKRQTAVHKVPMGGFVVQDLGRTATVMKGEGEFFGAGAYDTFQELLSVFQKGGQQMLVHLQAARILWWHPAHILRENSLRSLQPAQKISISLI